MPRRPLAVALAASVLVLSGCGVQDLLPGSGSDDEPTVDRSTSEGTAVPELLSRWRCAAEEDGTWTAGGTVTNPTESAVSYRVTVQVGPAGSQAAAVERDLDAVPAGGSTTFELTDVPASGEGPCHVRLLALPDADE